MFFVKEKKTSGFSLIELMVVISIIAILSTISAVSYNSVRVKERDTRRLTDMKKISFALERYRDAHGTFPMCRGCDYDSSGAWFECLGKELKPYLGEIPVDPLEKLDFYYCYSAYDNKVFLSYSLEGDGSEKNSASDSSHSNDETGFNVYHIVLKRQAQQ